MKTLEFDEKTFLLLETAADADEMVSDETIQDCLEGWFGDRRTVPEQGFIDRLVNTKGAPPWDGSRPGFDIESYDNPAAKRLLSRARRIKRELND